MYLDGSGTRTIFEKLTRHNDDIYAAFGSDSDLRIYHDGSNPYIEQASAATGDWIIQQKVDDGDIIFKSDDGSGGTTEYFRLDCGNTNVSISKQFNFVDSVVASFGSSADLQIYHDGTDSHIRNTQSSGDLIIRNSVNSKDIIFQCDDGSGGDTEYFRVDGGATTMVASKDVHFADNVTALLGNISGTSELKLYHDGENYCIQDTGTDN